MNLEILNIGTDILSESSVGSNYAYIAHKLKMLGVEVTRCCFLNGAPAETSKILTEIAQRSDIALVVGGLGPGDDDLTPVAAARAAEVALVLDQQVLESIENEIKAPNKALSEPYKKQAMLPAGAQCLNNSVGVTPGFHIHIGQCDFFFLPEDPFELRRMLTDQVLPRIIEIKGPDTVIHPIKTLSTFGLTKSAVSDQLNGLSLNFSGIKLGIRAKFPGVQVLLSAYGTDEEQMRAQMEMATRWVCRKLGDKVISDAGESMEKVIGNLLRQNDSSLALAESCTGGLIADLVTNVPGSSDYFAFSAVTYSNRLKMKILDVTARTLDQYGAVSEQTAKQMARGVQQVSNATFGLSISGIAGPGGATDDKPVGTVCIGLADTRSVQGYRFNFTYENRWMNKCVFAITALDMLRRKLLGISC
jgi:competence/damage-inducible protein CinA-like protein